MHVIVQHDSFGKCFMRSAPAARAACQLLLSSNRCSWTTRSVKAQAEARDAGKDTISPNLKLLLDSRKLLEYNAPVEVLPVRGVSFDGRQDLLQQLSLRQAVLAVQEPDNLHDPMAVRLETTGGDHIGYVPRHLTGLFRKEEVNPGHVESKGPTQDNSLMGVRVRLWPTLPAVTLDLMPPSWEARVDLPRVLGPDHWRALSEAVLDRSRGACHFTGVRSALVPVEAVPVFRFSPAARRVTAVGLVAASAPVARAKRLDKVQGREERLAALGLLVGLNGWGQEDLELYLRRVHDRRRQLEDEQWELDLSALKVAGS